MKDKRDERKWLILELEADPQGYLQAQRARLEDEGAERARDAEQWDLEAFTALVVAGGGSRSEAAEAWRRRREELATEAAEHADEQARRVQHGATMWAL